ncbi:hypothetical protein NUU17_25605, partial [Escherichia coli]|nr:hypothetical protein [Escherichia coli]
NGGTYADDKGEDNRDEIAAAFPEIDAWERDDGEVLSAGMAVGGFENKIELTKRQMDNEKEIV